jgi:hypothetical protein
LELGPILYWPRKNLDPQDLSSYQPVPSPAFLSLVFVFLRELRVSAWKMLSSSTGPSPRQITWNMAQLYRQCKNPDPQS